MTERAGIGVKKDYKLLNWEQNDFPILCQTCMGDSKFLRMLKKPLGAECRICTRPFTVFKWNSKSENTRQRRTEVCSTCAKINNCCQSCAHDLQFNLPIEIRNKLLGDHKIDLLMSNGNKDVFAHLANEQIDKIQLPYEKLEKYLQGNQQGIANISKIIDIESENPNEEEVIVDQENIRRHIYDRYLLLNPEQREIVKAIDQAEQITKKYGNDNECCIELYFVDEDELIIIQKKIENVLEDIPFTLTYEDGKAYCTLDDVETAERFLKVFSSGFVIKGRMLSMGWKKPKGLDDFDDNFFGIVTEKFLPKEGQTSNLEAKLGKRELIEI